MKVTILTVCIIFSCCRSLSAQRSEPAPNILLIFADDLGYGELGCYGQEKIRTPHLDRMAEEGIRFTDFYSSSALCAPALCQLLTGLHSGHAQIRANHEMSSGPDSFTDLDEGGQMPLSDGVTTIAEKLKAAGYATAVVGKWGLGMADTEGNPQRHGFDHAFGYLDQKQAHNHFPTHLWEDGKRYPLRNEVFRVHTKVDADQATDSVFNSFIGREFSGDVMLEKAKSFIRDHRTVPFFLYYAPTLPHLALQVPEESLRVYRGRFPETPYLGDRGYCPSKFPRATYAAMVSHLDRQVGGLLSVLRENGLEENTLVVFTSDNGSAFQTGGADPEFFKVNGDLRGYKGSLYEGGLRVPCIVGWKGKIKPAVSPAPLVGYDLFPTLMETAGLESAGTDGISFLPLLKGERRTIRRHIYFELFEYGGQLAVRKGRWKAVRRNMLADPGAPWELYDLSVDRGESTNLAAKHPWIVRRLSAISAKEHRQALVPEWNFMVPTITR